MAETTEQAVAWRIKIDDEYGGGYALAPFRHNLHRAGMAEPLYAADTIATLIAERDRALAALDAMRAERDAAAEDERDRIYALAVERVRQHHRGAVNAAGWLTEIGAMLPFERAALRALATQEKPQGIPAGKEG